MAVYYTLADIVLLCQCFYYRGFTWKDEISTTKTSAPAVGEPSERTGLLPPTANGHGPASAERRGSNWSAADAVHLSPVTPMLPASKSTDAVTATKPTTRLQATLFNLFAVVMVMLAGLLGWYISSQSQSGTHHRHHSAHHPHHKGDESLSFSLWGQIFGYFCAVLYLGSRIPQILLNYRRKSTEGVSMLFFLFACIGNLTYVLSIFAFEASCRGSKAGCGPGEAGRVYGRYILVNASWLAGSLGTLFLDFGIFTQFFIYRAGNEAVVEEVDEERVVDQRPLLQRGDSDYRS